MNNLTRIYIAHTFLTKVSKLASDLLRLHEDIHFHGVKSCRSSVLMLILAVLQSGCSQFVSQREKAHVIAPTQSKVVKYSMVIGNGGYRFQGADPLPNPVNDASSIRSLLLQSGFSVDYLENATADEIEAAQSTFADRAAVADIVLLYFAGHGAQANGQNFLIGVDKLDRRNSLDRFLEGAAGARKLGLVLLDACRDNPFAKMLGDNNRGVARAQGLAAEQTPKSGGIIIQYATAAGKVALDGPPGGHSPYAAALLDHLGAVGDSARDVLDRVGKQVLHETNGGQEPWITISAGAGDCGINPIDVTDICDGSVKEKTEVASTWMRVFGALGLAALLGTVIGNDDGEESDETVTIQVPIP